MAIRVFEKLWHSAGNPEGLTCVQGCTHSQERPLADWEALCKWEVMTKAVMRLLEC